MAPEQSTQAEDQKTSSRFVAGKSIDAIERGALRRRAAAGRARGLYADSAGATGGQAPAGEAESVRAHPGQLHLKLLSPGRTADSAGARRGTLDAAERDYVVGELTVVRRTLASLQEGLAEDRRAVRAALEELTKIRGETSEWGAAIDHLRAQVERLEERLESAYRELVDEADRLEDTERISQDNPGSENEEPPIARLAEEQQRLAATVAALSKDLVAERLRTTTIIFVGIAAATVAAAVWLLVSAPSF